ERVGEGQGNRHFIGRVGSGQRDGIGAEVELFGAIGFRHQYGSANGSGIRAIRELKTRGAVGRGEIGNPSITVVGKGGGNPGDIRDVRQVSVVIICVRVGAAKCVNDLPNQVGAVVVRS